jgi:hypothetical protein
MCRLSSSSSLQAYQRAAPLSACPSKHISKCKYFQLRVRYKSDHPTQIRLFLCCGAAFCACAGSNSYFLKEVIGPTYLYNKGASACDVVTYTKIKYRAWDRISPHLVSAHILSIDSFLRFDHSKFQSFRLFHFAEGFQLVLVQSL